MPIAVSLSVAGMPEEAVWLRVGGFKRFLYYMKLETGRKERNRARETQTARERGADETGERRGGFKRFRGGECC